MKAMTFEDVLKFNPYHDSRGRFSYANSAASFTYAPGKSTAHSKAIEREKEKDKGGTSKGFNGTLYHGSPEKDIKEFDISRAGKNTSSGEKLLYFTDSKQLAEDFSYERLDGSSKFFQRRGEKGRVYEVDVEMKNPLDLRNLSDTDIDNIIKLDSEGLLTRDMVKTLSANHQLLKASLTLTSDSLKSLGYDGLIAETGKAGHNSLEYAVVDSNQTKIRKSYTEVTDGVNDFTIYKSDDDKRLVFGWASISITADGEQLEDRQNDIIDPEDLEEAAYEYVLNFRDTGEEHIKTMRKKGKLVESCVLTEEKQKAMGIPPGILPVAWWIGFKIEDDDAWQRVKNGTYKMFSIEGKANRIPVKKAESVAKTFSEVLKFNPYHDSRGRFSSANSAASFTYSPGKSKAHDLAIQREKDRMAAADSSSGTDQQKSAIIKGPSEKITTYYRKAQGFQSAYYKNDVMEATLSDDGKTLSFNRAVGTWTTQSSRTQQVDYEIDAGSVDGRLVNIDLSAPTLTTVNGNTYNIRQSLRDAGFQWDAANKQYVRGTQQSSSAQTASNGHLIIPAGGSLPSDLTGINRISGNTYANKNQIKAAGFKWDPQAKEWVRPGLAKSAVILLDDMPALTFSDVLKFNPYHDARGRFTSSSAGKGSYHHGTSMSTRELINSGILGEYACCGVRTLTQDEDYDIGDKVRDSYDWDFEEGVSSYDTDSPKRLPGSCTIGIDADMDPDSRWVDEPEDIEAAINMAMSRTQDYEGDRKVIIGGTEQISGDDDYEQIIRNPRVVAIYDKATGNWITKQPQKKKNTKEDVGAKKQEYKRQHDELLASLQSKYGKFGIGNASYQERQELDELKFAMANGYRRDVGKSFTSSASKNKQDSAAKTFEEVLKFNPYHDSRGRFSTANGYAYFTTATKDPKKQHWADAAIAREKQKQPPAPPKPTKNYDKLGFADYDDADYHQLHSGRQYYQQQNLTATQKKAVDAYLEADPEIGSLYSHSQNMNWQMANGQQLTGKYKQTHDGLMDAMHNVGYNVELTRYDHPDMVDGMLKALGAGTNYSRMSQAQLKKALVGQTVNENKFLSTSYNDFQNAPSSSKSVFATRAVKVNYKVKADVQGMMPGKGSGGDLGEIILAPTNGTANRGGKITDVRLTGQMVRRKGTQMYDQPRIEIDIEI